MIPSITKTPHVAPVTVPGDVPPPDWSDATSVASPDLAEVEEDIIFLVKAEFEWFGLRDEPASVDSAEESKSAALRDESESVNVGDESDSVDLNDESGSVDVEDESELVACPDNVAVNVAVEVLLSVVVIRS